MRALRSPTNARGDPNADPDPSGRRHPADYACGNLLADRRLRVTLLPRRRDVWLLVQNHPQRDAAARAVIDWVRDCFQEIARG